MAEITGVLLDATGIQQYIFGSNKLKENLGASYLVGNIYNNFLKEVAANLFNGRIVFDKWKTEQDRIYITDIDMDMEVGYIGGGNALLFFKEQFHANNFIKEWSKRLLVETPGLSTAVAIGIIDTDKPQNGITDLFKSLNTNKFVHHPQVTLPGHGITTECSRTGLSAEYLYLAKEDAGKHISSVAASKLQHKGLALDMFHNKFKTVLNQYEFPKKLDKLGQFTGESHIAIVHIDGNGMGKRFMACETIKDLRGLSVSVQNATENAMKSLLDCIIGDYPNYKKDFKLDQDILPIRPIVIGGDDVTFVCDARLGVYFAEIFLESFLNEHVGDGRPLSACAGIAITKTKYPFYRGYGLAEELCSSAKKMTRDGKDESWLDFHIAYGGFTGELSDIRQNHYTVKEGDLWLRPYRVHPSTKDPRSFKSFKTGMKSLSEWPKSKQKELRDALVLGGNATTQFIKEMEYRKHFLPEIPGVPSLKDTGWDNSKTPYFDMLELMEFYPMDKI